MEDFEKAVEDLKFEFSLSKSQRFGKTVLAGTAGMLATAAASNAFNSIVKALRARNTVS